MSRILEILILIGTFVSVIYILLRIHKLKIKMEDTVFWICFAVLIAVLGTIPEVASWMATLLGIQSPVNLVFLVIIGLLIEKLFTISVTLSMLEEKVTILSAELAIRSRDAAEGRKELREELSEAEKKIDMTKSNEDAVSE
ncbi:MAG: DUF2304 domain-containing protein [Clostridiales bacterium]|nr:DUF2304 domain-containing protein [Clostridiales bacterium]